MKQVKIFFGNFDDKKLHADEKCNAWIKAHPEYEVLDIKYQETGNDHSICVLYDDLPITFKNWRSKDVQ